MPLYYNGGAHAHLIERYHIVGIFRWRKLFLFFVIALESTELSPVFTASFGGDVKSSVPGDLTRLVFDYFWPLLLTTSMVVDQVKEIYRIGGKNGISQRKLSLIACLHCLLFTESSNFCIEKIIADKHKVMKFANVFFLESLPLYGSRMLVY